MRDFSKSLMVGNAFNVIYYSKGSNKGSIGKNEYAG